MKITHLSLKFNMYTVNDEFHTLLMKMQNLISLSLAGSMNTRRRTTVPWLPTLTIRRNPEMDARAILVTPSLKTLHLEKEVGTEDLPRFFQQSKCTLETPILTAKPLGSWVGKYLSSNEIALRELVDADAVLEAGLLIVIEHEGGVFP
ncbi:hypothetical protein BDQ17DRAFT_1414459 [Cyathus striatus]|nr:hypothetical protein BDQ17DRAFT_1414459 [Cyathus striatus]